MKPICGQTVIPTVDNSDIECEVMPGTDCVKLSTDVPELISYTGESLTEVIIKLVDKINRLEADIIDLKNPIIE